ncbi:MAG: DNA-directed RNA polymerase subunit omega [Desulfatiglandaceae bacterium]
MARITVEDCLNQIDNRFALIHLAAKRVRQLRKGAEPLAVCKNKDIVTALREIAAGKVVKVEKEGLEDYLEDIEPTLPLDLSHPETEMAPLDQAQGEPESKKGENE